MTIRAADAANKPLVRFNGDKPDNMVTIADGGKMVIENITFAAGCATWFLNQEAPLSLRIAASSGNWVAFTFSVVNPGAE